MAQKEMITRVDIGDSGRMMVITKDAKGQLKSVKDDLGKKAQEANASDLKISNEVADEKGKRGNKKHFRAAITGARDDTVILTHHNPTCCWYFFGGRWYWLCY